jgi:regulatory protein
MARSSERSAASGEPRARRPQKRARTPYSETLLEEAALSYLNRFDASADRLRKRLAIVARRHGAELAQAKPHIDALIARFSASGVLNDERFAQNLAARLRDRGASRRLILMKLRARGIASHVAEASISDGGSAELEAARAFVKKKRIGRHRPEELQQANRRKDLAALARAGYDHDVAVRALGYGRDDDF